MIRNFWPAVLLLFLFSCKTHVNPDGAIISGVFKGGKGQKLILSELKTQRSIAVDSVIVDALGNFQLEVLPSEKGFFLIQSESYPTISLVLDKGDLLELSFDALSLSSSYQLSGSEDSQILLDYYQRNTLVKTEIDSLRKVMYDSRPLENFYLIKFEIDSTLGVLLQDHKDFTRDLIIQNPGNLASLLLINQSFAGDLLFKMSDEPELYLMLDDSLMKNYPNNSHVKSHHSRCVRLQQEVAADVLAEARVSPGKIAPDFKLTNLNGKPIALTDFRGENLLLFFWSSWSPQSRADIQQLKELYNSNPPGTFEVFAVSLDHKESFWKSAIEVEELTWVNLVDLSGVGGSVSSLFNLSAQLPYYYLLNKDGIIVGKTGDFTEMKKGLIEIVTNQFQNIELND